MKKIAAVLLSLMSLNVANAYAEKIDKPTKKVHLIWEDNEGLRWAGDWIKEVLDLVDYDEVFDEGNFETMLEDSIVVIGSSHSSKQLKYFRDLKNAKYRFAVIVLSDENYTAAEDFYPTAKFVLRNYWHDRLSTKDNVLTFPLGYKGGFWQEGVVKIIKRAEARKYVWSFAGETEKSTRLTMVKHMKKVPNFELHETAFFGSGLSTLEYRNLMQESIFVPCPRGGSNLDTFRLYEALECGCIPIIEKYPVDYFGKSMGTHPFLSVDHWSEAPELINHLLENPEELEKLRAKCQRWWVNYKSRLQRKVAHLVEQKFVPAESASP